MPRKRGPRAPRPPLLARAAQHEIDTAAQRIFEAALPTAWVARPLHDPDYGIDYQLEVFEAQQPVALRTAMQLKGTTRIAVLDDAIHFSLATRALATYVDAEVLPVFLVVVDVDAKIAYFAFLQRYALDVLKGTTWRDQDSVTIVLPCADRVDATPRLRAALADAHRYMALVRPAAIEGAIAAEQQRLQTIDPRFLATITADARVRHVTLTPLKPVSFQLGFTKGVDAARVHAFVSGASVAFAPGELRIRGMPIWEHLNAAATEVRIGVDFPCAVTLALHGAAGARAELVNVPVTITRGIEGYRLVCTLPGDLFTFTLSAMPPKASATPNVQANFALSLKAWRGHEVRALPFFDEIRAFAALFDGAVAAELTIHLPARNLAWPRFELPARATAAAFAEAVETLRKAREIAARLGCSLLFKEMVRDEDVVAIDRIHALVTTGEHRGPGEGMIISLNYKKDEMDPRLLQADPGDFVMRVKGRTETESVFGSPLVFPVGAVILTNAQTPRAVRTRKRNEVRVEIRGSAASEFVMRASAEPDADDAAPPAAAPEPPSPPAR